jgi:hypothetical protein
MECIPMFMKHHSDPIFPNYRYTKFIIEARIEEAALGFALTLGAHIL